MTRLTAPVAAAALLFVIYTLTLAPDVTFWDAGEFIAASYTLGIPHPPGTPLFILIANVWGKLLFFLPFAVAVNLLSAAATAVAGGVIARLVYRATSSGAMALAAALVAGTMSSVWLNATETEVYATSLLLAMLMIAAADESGRATRSLPAHLWMLVAAYLMALAVPLHLSALVVAPAAVALVGWSATPAPWSRVHAVTLAGVFVVCMGVGRMNLWITVAGALLVTVALRDRRPLPAIPIGTLTILGVVALGLSAIAFMYVRSALDPGINQTDASTWNGLVGTVARKQYAVAPMWPRRAALWIQFGNLVQYADWQSALSLGPTVYPSIARTLFTVLFVGLGILGAREHWRRDRRTAAAFGTLLLCGAVGVLAYLNLAAGPSIGHGIISADAAREARERDYFYVFAFWGWGVWAGVGAVSLAQRLGRPAWAGVVLACLPLALNWRAVTRRTEPDDRTARMLAETMLASAPRDAVLFSVGDNDSYPLWYAQEVLAVRRDVTIITVPLLPTRWYRAQIARRTGLLQRPVAPGYRAITETVAEAAGAARERGRPIAVSMMAPRNARLQLGPRWTARGLVYVEGDAGVDTAVSARIAAAVEARLGRDSVRASIDPTTRYFRALLDCPRRLLASDSTALDSTCNYP